MFPLKKERVQDLGFYAPNAGEQVRFLVRELRPCMLHRAAKIQKKRNSNNKLENHQLEINCISAEFWKTLPQEALIKLTKSFNFLTS